MPLYRQAAGGAQRYVVELLCGLVDPGPGLLRNRPSPLQDTRNRRDRQLRPGRDVVDRRRPAGGSGCHVSLLGGQSGSAYSFRPCPVRGGSVKTSAPICDDEAVTTHEREDQLFLVRHGETEWSRSGRHTSVTDLPLTPDGERVATGLKQRLAGEKFDLVLTSPGSEPGVRPNSPATRTRRSTTTWSSGTTATTRASPPRRSARPCPAGRSGPTRYPTAKRPPRSPPAWTASTPRIAAVPGDVLVFGHSHALRALTARWLELDVTEGRHFVLNTATISVLGWERGSPAIHHWNN
jgi:probable phosphoglycerate mutase